MRKIAQTALLLVGLASVSAIAYDETVGIKNFYYSAASYCDDLVKDWKCGPPCSDGP
jgi:hypothetical protein